MRIVDAHHHLWDRDRHPYPWLAAPTVSGLVGDTTALCRNYLLPDFMADAASAVDLVKSVHLQAEIDASISRSRRPAGCRPSPTPRAVAASRTASSPMPISPTRRSTAPWRRMRPSLTPAASARSSIATMTRASISSTATTCAKRRWQPRPRPAAGARPLVRHAALRAADGRRCRHRAPPSRHARSSSTTPACRSTATAGRSGRLAQAACAHPGRLPQRRRQDLGPRHDRPSLDRGKSIRPSCSRRSTCSAPARCLFASNFPVDSLFSDYTTVWTAFDTLTTSLSPAERLALFHDNAIHFYRL